MATADFSPQLASLGYGWPTVAQAALSEFVPALAIDRYPVRAGSVGLTTAAGRADVSSDMGGLFGEQQGPVTTFEHTGTIINPLGPDTFNLGLLAQHAGAIGTPVQDGSDDSHEITISPDEVATDLKTRFVTVMRDLRDGNPVIYNPCGVKQVSWGLEVGGLVLMEYTLMPLWTRYHDLAATVAGSPAQNMITRGILNPTNNALTDRKIFIKVTAYADPAATLLMAFAATPVGSVTFPATAGKDLELRPLWARVVDGGGLPAGVRIGKADAEFEVALLDPADVTVLDEVSFDNPIPDPTITRPTTPTFTVSSTCIVVNGTKVADLGSSTWVTVNDLGANPGGACSAYPSSYFREGVSTSQLTFDRRMTTFRLEKDLLDDQPFTVLIEGTTDVLVDSGGAEGNVFDWSATLNNCQFEGGQNFKTLTSATDTTSTYVVRSSPSTGVPQYVIKMRAQFSDPLA